MRGKNKEKAKRKSNKIITSSIIKITTLFVFVAIIAMLYQNSMTNNIVADNNRQRAQEKLETVKGSKLKIGDYVNYDHTIQVDPNTKETISVPKDKLTYTSVKGDLDNSGNGVGTQTVDVSGYKTKWRVYDIQGNQVLLMPETQPTAEITTKSALGYLWYEKETHNIAGLYGHGYGADETREFNYEVGSRIPSEGDTRTETTKGTGARPMLLSDIEEAYGITTDKQRQELNDHWETELGSNELKVEVYYPTLNKENARVTENTTLKYQTGDIGVSKTRKKLTDIKEEFYSIEKLDKVHTKTYDAKTGKDIQKEIIHNSFDTDLGSRFSWSIGEWNVPVMRYHLNSNGFNGANIFFVNCSNSYFYSGEYSAKIRPIVFLSSANNYYKEQGEGEYATYSLIKEENAESQHPKIQNPYNVSLNNVILKGTYADRLLFESKLDAPLETVPHSITRADGTEVIGDITYTVEGLPEGITYDVVKKEVDGKEEVIVQIYPKELSVVANINKKDIYEGAKYSYDILLDKNGINIDTKQLDETANGKVEIAKYTDKEDIIDEEGNAVNYILDIANFNDTVRKDNTYYTNTITKEDNTNSNEIIYNLNIVYDNAKYNELINNITTSLDNIEKRVNTLEENDNTKKEDITKLEEEVKTAEDNGGTDVLGKKKLEEGIADIKKRQEDEKTERDNLEKELKSLIAGNEKALENDKELKAKADKLTKKINDLKDTIEKDDAKIKELENKIGKIKVLNVKDIEDLKKKVADLEKENEQNKKDLDENKKTIKNLNELIEKLKEENKDAVDKITKEKEELEEKNKELEEENKKLKDTLTELQAEIEQLKNLEQDNKDLKNKIADLEGKLLEAEAKQNDLKEKLDKCGKHGKELQEKIEELEKTIKEQDEKIKKLEQEKADLEKRNKELEEKNKLNEEELKEKELLEKKIKELEEKAKKLEAEKEALAKKIMEQEKQKEEDNKKDDEKEENNSKANNNSNNNNKNSSEKNDTVASKTNKNNSNNTSNNRIPYAGAESLIILTIITIGAIVYTKKVMSKK